MEIMKEITIRIPDEQVDFVMELIAQLGLEAAEDDYEIPEEHKEIVRERIRKSKPENLIPWEEARKQLKFKKVNNSDEV